MEYLCGQLLCACSFVLHVVTFNLLDISHYPCMLFHNIVPCRWCKCLLVSTLRPQHVHIVICSSVFHMSFDLLEFSQCSFSQFYPCFSILHDNITFYSLRNRIVFHLANEVLKCWLTCTLSLNTIFLLKSYLIRRRY